MSLQPDWVVSINQKLKRGSEMKDRKPWEKHCIYKVPSWMKGDGAIDDIKDGYTPELISFGPYHHGLPHLEPMEEHKWRVLNHMLAREEQNIIPYLVAVKELEQQVRSCYDTPLVLDSDKFVEILILDGCFVLEFLRGKTVGGHSSLKYERNDPIFSKQSICHVIAMDMMKIENQIPLIVLEKLLELQYNNGAIPKEEVPRLVMSILTPEWVAMKAMMNEDELTNMKEIVAKQLQEEPPEPMLHCLDVFWRSLRYKSLSNSSIYSQASSTSTEELIPGDEIILVEAAHGAIKERLPSSWLFKFIYASVHKIRISPGWLLNGFAVNNTSNQRSEIHLINNDDVENLTPNNKIHDTTSSRVENEHFMAYCISDLRQAGIEFRPRYELPFWNINFREKRGILEIHPIKIDWATETVFRNLMAYEHCHTNYPWDTVITDYVAFMDNLIDTAADVAYLHHAGIIVHYLGSDAEVADLFNRLAKKVYIDKSEGRLNKVYKQLNEYCSHRRNIWLASLNQEYLKNPWIITSILAAIILFLLTALQTFYTVYPYYTPRN